jgi:peptidoglycan/xylan/chitin deacetylase (PgdA/CDA1 family)
LNIALKVDVSTYRGTRDGVPALLDLLQQHAAGATFLFSMGPDHTGRAIRRIFKPGFLRKIRRTAAISRYGFPGLFYGTLLPGPDIGKRCGEVMRAARDAGFEVGIHAWDATSWHDHVARADEAWTRQEMERARERFRAILGEDALVHGAAGWQMNRHAYRLSQALGFGYCSDTRGTCPFVPVFQAEVMACPQVPTTLPTLDEVIGSAGGTADQAADHILQLSRDSLPSGHVYTVRAEVEGLKLKPVFDRMLSAWRAEGHRLLSLSDYFDALPDKHLPRYEVGNGEMPGHSGVLAAQGAEFLANWQGAAISKL